MGSYVHWSANADLGTTHETAPIMQCNLPAGSYGSKHCQSLEVWEQAKKIGANGRSPVQSNEFGE